MTVGAIITARMASTRFPGKVLAPVCGKPVLLQLVTRLFFCKEIDKIIIAATTNGLDGAISKYFPSNMMFRGSETNVMERVIRAAGRYGIDIIVDITADCPLVDISLISGMVSHFKKHPELDYISNVLNRECPDGLDVQVYKRKALEEAYTYTYLEESYYIQRQHVGWNISRMPEKFNLQGYDITITTEGAELYNPKTILTLDYPEDLKVIEAIFGQFISRKRPLFNSADIMAFLKAYPKVLKLNEGLRRKMPEEG